MSNFHIEDLKAQLASRIAALGADTAKVAREQRMNDARILALTLFGEGRGESLDGRVAIGWTAKNRSLKKGQTVATRCLQKSQYSCWWPFGGAENYRRLLDLAEKVMADDPFIKAQDLPIYAECFTLAAGVLDGTLRDRTNGSTHYYNPAAMVPRDRVPAWVEGRPPTAVVGSHRFYANIPWS